MKIRSSGLDEKHNEACFVLDSLGNSWDVRALRTMIDAAWWTHDHLVISVLRVLGRRSRLHRHHDAADPVRIHPTRPQITGPDRRIR
jgi:hypothetical protein